MPPSSALTSSQMPLCARHPDARASIICSRCGSYACDACRKWGADGQDYCESCAPQELELAEAGTRFVANLVDSLVWAVPWFGASLLQFLFKDSPIAVVLMLTGVLAALGLLGYQAYLVSESGQSIGKRMMGIRTVRVDGSRASLGRIIFLRNVVPSLIGSLCGLFGLIDALFIFGDQRRCLHDMIADTIVVKVSR